LELLGAFRVLIPALLSVTRQAILQNVWQAINYFQVNVSHVYQANGRQEQLQQTVTRATVMALQLLHVMRPQVNQQCAQQVIICTTVFAQTA
jgi:hypothetical protein